MTNYIDLEFYKNIYDDLKDLTITELLDHYNNYGKNEGRYINETQFYELNTDFDNNFIRSIYNELKDVTDHELIKHYISYEKTDKNDKIVINQTKFYEIYPDFDIEFYRNIYDDLKDLTITELLDHYNKYGKNEGRYINETQFYELNTDFNNNFTRNIHDELKKNINEQIIKHYISYEKTEGRYINEKQFYEIYPDFDIEFYRNIHDDLDYFPSHYLLDHYNKYGKNEGRYINKSQFYEKYPDFDFDFYKTTHEYLFNLTEERLIWHYLNHGKNEQRLFNKSQFYEKYPDFDIDFYKINNVYLYGLSNEKLIGHYINNDNNEELVINEKQVYEKYPDFDIDFYKLYPDFDLKFYKNFNEELKDFSDIKLLFHYHNIGHLTNKKYFEYDFIVDDDYKLPDLINDKTKDLIFNHYYIRKIKNYEELLEYHTKFEKKYYICNKISFYEYYYDFNYRYYKKKYFKKNKKNKNNNISENDILLHYHLKGKYEKHIINNKINFIVYIPPYNHMCGGIVVLHYFCKLINEKYNDKFCAKIFMHNNIKYKNPFCNYFAKIDEINDNSFVIYPETFSGNPLNSKNVIRWVLLELGIEMPLDHYKNWNETDLIYNWEKQEKQLSCPFYNNIFTDKKLINREKTCYLIKKGRLIHENIEYIHPEDSICIDDLSLQEKSNIFNECKFFYSYDPNTAYIIFSASCGCVPIIYGIEGVDEDEYFKSKMFNVDGTIYNKGIVYGNNLEKINEKINYILENKLNENNEEYYKNLFTMIEKKTIPLFLDEINKLIVT